MWAPVRVAAVVAAAAAASSPLAATAASNRGGGVGGVGAAAGGEGVGDGAAAAPKTQPHLVFVMADDLGSNDVGWSDPTVISPTIDRLALR